MDHNIELSAGFSDAGNIRVKGTCKICGKWHEIEYAREPETAGDIVRDFDRAFDSLTCLHVIKID
jgi:hypothetical protein